MSKIYIFWLVFLPIAWAVVGVNIGAKNFKDISFYFLVFMTIFTQLLFTLVTFGAVLL